MGVIYVDVLVIINALIGYFALRSAAALASLYISAWRMCVGALLCGLSSLLILFDLQPFLALVIKIVSVCAIIFAAFPLKDARTFLKALIWYIIINFILGGMSAFAAQNGSALYDNYSFYIYVPPLLLVFCTVLMYVLIQLCVWIFGRPKAAETVSFELIIGNEDTHIKGTALLDTGFNVKDPLTDNPAALFSEKVPISKAYFEKGEVLQGVRLLPINTASGSALLPAVTAQLTINGKGCKSITAVFTNKPFSGGFTAILNADMGVYF